MVFQNHEEEIMKYLKVFKISYESRLATYKSWPYDEDSLCNVKKMAEAGFYWTGNQKEVDIATCFACGKVLDGWESTDDPWIEHKKHAPQCYFLKLEKHTDDLTIQELFDLSTHCVLFSIQQNTEMYAKELRSIADKKRDKFVSNF